MPTKPNPLPRRAIGLVDDALMALAVIDRDLERSSELLEPLLNKSDPETLVRAARSKELITRGRLELQRAVGTLTQARQIRAEGDEGWSANGGQER